MKSENKLTTLRRKYLIDYKENGNKDSFEKLIFTYINNIKNTLDKYLIFFEKEELISICTEIIIKTIKTFDYNLNLNLLTTYINRNIQKKLNKIIENKKLEQNNICYEFYYKTHKKGEDNTITENHILNIIEKEKLKKIIDMLPEIQKQVIVYRFGLFENDTLTLEELANKLNRSKGGIDQIEELAKKNIKRLYKKYT